MDLEQNVLNMTHTERVRWWETFRKEQASWGGLLLEPYPELLTNWYAERLLDGDILASKENIAMAKRHLNDLKRQGTDEFPWIFDEEKGHRPIRFVEENCKPTEGDFEKFILQPWQHFVVGSVFGWVHKDTGVRRFREALVFLGRKNGKTSLISALSNYMMGYDEEQGANIYVLANAKEQANILFEKTKEMVKMSPRLAGKFKNQRNVIKDEKSFSKMEARASDSRKLDGLNTHFAIFDEIHEFVNFKLINVIKKSRAARRQPLLMYITTAGYILDGPLMQYIENALDCAAHMQDTLNERVFYFIAKLDNVQEADNPKMWLKSNPNLLLMNFVDLVADWLTERRIQEERADWITKQFNLFSNIDELSYVDMPTIDKNNKQVDLATFQGKEAIIGYDLSETEDFTAVVVEIPIINTGEIIIICHSWISQARYDKDGNKQRLDKWIAQGHLTVTPGAYVKYEFVLDWIIEQGKIYRIVKIRYDRRNSLALNQELESRGFSMEEVRQVHMILGGPMKHFKELMLDGKVIYNQASMFRWYLSNVKLAKDRNSNWMPTKQSKNRKIDGYAATLNAHCSVIDMLITPKGDGNIQVLSMSDLLK